jgi:hypothetical protein
MRNKLKMQFRLFKLSLSERHKVDGIFSSSNYSSKVPSFSSSQDSALSISQVKVREAPENKDISQRISTKML